MKISHSHGGRWRASALLAAAAAGLAASVAWAQSNPPAQPAAQDNSKTQPQSAQPVGTQAQPPTAGATRPPPARPVPAALQARPGAVPGQPPAAKPGMEAPKPTVQLKPGEVPAIEFDTPIYDFGRVRAGLEINHDFWFTNTGNGPLEILQVKPS